MQRLGVGDHVIDRELGRCREGMFPLEWIGRQRLAAPLESESALLLCRIGMALNDLARSQTGISREEMLAAIEDFLALARMPTAPAEPNAENSDNPAA